MCLYYLNQVKPSSHVNSLTVADPGFPVEGHRPPTQALFSENICENERIGSCWEGGAPSIRQWVYTHV